MQELRQWQREWREESQAAKRFSLVADVALPADDRPSTPPPDAENTGNADESTVEAARAEDADDKTDEKESIHRAEESGSPGENTRRLDTGCVC